MDVEKAMRQAKASLSIEGMEVKKSHDLLVKSVLTGAITNEDFENRIMELLLLEEESEK